MITEVTEIHLVDPKTKMFLMHGVGISPLSRLVFANDREIFKGKGQLQASDCFINNETECHRSKEGIFFTRVKWEPKLAFLKGSLNKIFIARNNIIGFCKKEKSTKGRGDDPLTSPAIRQTSVSVKKLNYVACKK